MCEMQVTFPYVNY